MSAAEYRVAVDSMTMARSLAEAVDVMDRLWKFGGWEVTQTHESLRRYLLEETYELIDAIGAGDSDAIREELGDLLLQVLFHSRIAEAAGEFTVDDVATTLVAKLVHRSPHLDEAAQHADLDGDVDLEQRIAAQERAWQQRKSAEKSRRSCLDGIALAAPALALAEKIRSRALAAGLPADLIPEQLQLVHLGGPDSAEERLRTAALAFAAHIRAAEAAAQAAGAHPGPLPPDQWHTHWPA